MKTTFIKISGQQEINDFQCQAVSFPVLADTTTVNAANKLISLDKQHTQTIVSQRIMTNANMQLRY